ncbi:MAG: 1-deoxy-D-xylulose-5-phosphate reductoisomerase [Planctomycetes bacterium]|nr:1-deoxy-D-xylulose-5-phosphate reductoisomerase [Planctomycetota bacterium]
MKRIVVLGASGSIGRNALWVVENLRPALQAVGLGARADWRCLAEQARAHGIREAALTDPAAAKALQEAVPALRVRSGPDALERLVAEVDADLVLSAVSGAAGLGPTLAAIREGRDVALANKESLVMAGSVVTELAREKGVRILPVDSEHSAVFQALRAGAREEVLRIILTASGGPFRTLDRRALAAVTPEQALRHPTWRMGPKVTIDSATLMNKALEIIEARWLFDLRPDEIGVLIHPQSIVHSLVEYRDGSLIAQLGIPDMRIPIQYAFTFPERRPLPDARCDLAQVGRLEFFPPDDDRFPALGLAKKALEMGGTGGAVLNGANEVAVETFLAGRTPFPRIWEVVASALDAHRPVPDPTLRDILEADRWARLRAREML